MAMTRDDELDADEEIHLRTRPHRKALSGPAALFVLTSVVAALVIVALPGGKDEAPARVVVGVLAFVVVAVWCAVPYLRWRATELVLTDRRILVREGVVLRRRRDMPVSAVADLSVSRALPDRMLGSGTLIVDSRGREETLRFVDVPDVDRVQAELHRLVEAASPAGDGVDEFESDQ